MQAPLVTVIITTYNRFDLLCRAIKSVLTQTYKNIEIIVVDDCSSDGTKEKISKYHKSITYLRNKDNLGLSSSRNVGIQASSGEYISFLDDDDEIFPEKIEKQIKIFMEKKEVDVVYCGSIKKYKNRNIENLPKLKDQIYPEVLNNSPNAIHTLLIKKECIIKIGFFDGKLTCLEDFDLWIRLSRECCFDFVPECLVLYNMHGYQMSTDYKLNLLGNDVILDKHRDCFLKNKKYFYRHMRRQASRCAVNNDYSSFNRYIRKAILLRPLCPGSYCHLLLSLVSRHLHRKIINVFGIKNVDGIVKF